MATAQSFPMRLAAGNTSITTYCSGVSDGTRTWATSEEPVRCRAAGAAKNLIVKLASPPGSGKSITWVMQVNGVDSALTLTVSGTNTTGTSTGSVAIAVGDTLKWKRTLTNTPTVSAMLMTWEFHHDVASKNVHMGAFDITTGSVSRSGVFRCGLGSAATSATRSQLVSAAGNLTELDYTLTTAPGSGKSFTMVLLVNDVAQDGTGGTTNTTQTISDAATTARWTGSIALTTSDRVCIQYTPSGSPAAATMQVCVLFAPTTDGESNMVHYPSVNLPTSGTTYYVASQDSLTTSGAADTDAEQIVGVTTFELRKFRVRLNSTVSTGPIAFNTRKNNASTSITVSLSSGAQAGTDTTNTASYASGDTVALQYVVTGTPGLARQVVWSWAQFALAGPAEIKGSAVFGVNTTVTATRAIAFGLDDATNVLDEEGKFKVFGDFEVTGTTTLGAITSELTDLSDVTLTSPVSDNEHLVFNGTAWVNEALIERYAEVAVSSGELLALRATPKTLVAAPGAGQLLEFVSAVLLLDATATAYVETAANLAVRYTNGTGVKVSEDIEATGFIDQTADTMTTARPKLDTIVAKTGCENQALVLHNLGAGEYTTGTGTMRVKVAYRVWATGW